MLRRLLPLLASTVGLLVLFRIFVPNFWGADNLLDLLDQIAVNAILAFGMTLVILIGGIDLSVGALLALVGTVTCYSLTPIPKGWDMGLAPALAMGVGTAVFFGLFHGFAIAKTAMPPFIVTLGTMLVARGAALLFNNSEPLKVPDTQKFLLSIGNGHIAGSFPTSATIMLVCYALCAATLHFTIYGRHLYAIGDNRMAALYSGIRVSRNEISVYLIASVFTAIAGFIHTSQLFAAEPGSGDGFELNAIAAAVVGGASLRGGRGSMTGTLLGAIIMGILSKGLNQAGVRSPYQSIAKGSVILLAVWLDLRKKR